MATVRHIGLYDEVELLEPVESAPGGATGTVLEFHGDGDVAMVEFTSMPPEPLLDRLLIVPVSKLRLIESHAPDSSGSGPASSPDVTD